MKITYKTIKKQPNKLIKQYFEELIRTTAQNCIWMCSGAIYRIDHSNKIFWKIADGVDQEMRELNAFYIPKYTQYSVKVEE
jgi:hypothetical protein